MTMRPEMAFSGMWQAVKWDTAPIAPHWLHLGAVALPSSSTRYLPNRHLKTVWRSGMVTSDAARDRTQEVPMRYLASVFCFCTVLVSGLSASHDVAKAEDADVQSGIRPDVWPSVQMPKSRDDQAPPVLQPPPGGQRGEVQ